MKVYAEYFEENGLSFRSNTILQFGDSWELIGNVVLANPGSAQPTNKIDNISTDKLKEFYKSYRDTVAFKQDNWHEFKDDATMRFIQKIFSGGYVGKDKKLNGVIQLFNTFNIRNQNLEDAVKQIGVSSNQLFSIGVEDFFHDKPTYFGFSNAVLENTTLRPIAEAIFNSSSVKIKSIYNDSFSENAFYHPMYINRAHNQTHFQWYKEEVLKKIMR